MAGHLAIGPRRGEAPCDCPLCPRLVAFRAQNSANEPAWYNGAVASFGSDTGRLLIVGLAPGLRGANRSGRPFTGDFAGELLYQTLLASGFARGTYAARADDGLELVDCMITNAVRCVPPQNKPTPVEINTCRSFLADRIEALPRLRAILALGHIAHDTTLKALGARKAMFPFAHGAQHSVQAGLALFDSFHCSRYNTNTGKLTPAMFQAAVMQIRDYLSRH